MIKLVIDAREKQLIDTVTVPFTVKQLEIADILFYLNDCPYLAIERKTFADLAASIKDGRYNEQKLRYNKFLCSIKCYLLEGQNNRTYGKLTPSTLDSAILGTTLRDNFTYLHSDNITHTAQIIDKLFVKLPEYFASSPAAAFANLPPPAASVKPIIKLKPRITAVPDATSTTLAPVPDTASTTLVHDAASTTLVHVPDTDATTADATTVGTTTTTTTADIKANPTTGVTTSVASVDTDALQYIDVIKVNKKANITPAVCYAAQLCQIPGISSTIAKAIYTTYPSLCALVTFLTANTRECAVSKLATIQLSTKQLGPKLASKIYDYLVC